MCAGAGSCARRSLETDRRSQLGPWRRRRGHRPLRARQPSTFRGFKLSWTGSKRSETNAPEDEQHEGRSRRREEGEIKGWLAQARLALENGRDAEAIALGQQILAVRPDHVDALATTAFAQQRSGQLDQALASVPSA